MKAVAINGSPRKDGNTYLLLKEVLNVLEKEGIETKLLNVGATNIHGCRGCGACKKLQNKKCSFTDDVFNEIYAEIIDSDAIILGTPSYFSGMTPELKSLIDRAGVVAGANGGLLKHKVGAAVIAQRREGGVAVQGDIHRMFLMTQMIIAGSTYWNFGFGMNKGDVVNDSEAMANMQNLGENIAWLVKKINS